ncbi:N-acetylglucosamine kinase NAGK-like [Clostridioides difficile]|nr:N-acetylglucosamine kinase NAGK-like [Clostridioides difficile]
MKYLVSIDGGGTKTKFCVSDLDGNILKEHTTGSTNYKFCCLSILCMLFSVKKYFSDNCLILIPFWKFIQI